MRKSLLSLAVVAALASTAFAGDVRVSGFMNIVGGQSDVDNGASPLGYDDKYDFQNDSLAAIQFSASIADNMGATIQLIAQNQEVGDDIRMEWGFISYDATDEVRILAGRIRPALFLYSDYLDVGYAYNWVTPPSEVYDQVNISNLDGASVAYNLELGDNTLSTTIYGGNSSDNKVNPLSTATPATGEAPAAAEPLNLSFDSIIGAEISLSNDYGKIRAGYIQAKVTESTNTSVPAELAMDESSAAFYGVGINIDYEGVLFASEYIVRDMDETGSPDVNSYYAMLGYAIGDFTPNYTYAVADSDMEVSTSAAAGGVNQARAMNLDDRISHTIGVRYEVNAQAALKVEYNMATVTTSRWAAGTPALVETETDANTIRVALNVIF